MWWLLYGQLEYPAAWWFDSKQVAVAMESVSIRGYCLPRLLRRLYVARHDLQAAFPLQNAEVPFDLLCWYRLSAPSELPVAPALPLKFVHLTETLTNRSPWIEAPGVPRIAAAMYDRLPELRERFDPKRRGTSMALVRWYVESGHHLIPPSTPLPAWPEPTLPPRKRATPVNDCQGVNLVGFTRAEFGIGEDVRSVSAALEAVGFPHVIIDIKSLPHVRAHDDSQAHKISSAMPFNTNIFCLTAFDTAEFYLKRGPDPFAKNFNVGYWPWELEQFPSIWIEAFDLVDEVWAATRYQQRAYLAADRVPVFLMPPAVVLPSAGDLCRAASRRRKPYRFRFIFPFDPNSFLSRKNPCAAVRAFRLAFPTSDRGVELVLRVNGRPRNSLGWREVRAASLALLKGADCLISPHRAEGFGRNIAEAISLGVPVLATGYSGPEDFLNRNERVAARPRTVALNEYPYASGMSWADPVVPDLARRMRRVRGVLQGHSRPKPHNLRRKAWYAPRTAGRNYVLRLLSLWKEMRDCR